MIETVCETAGADRILCTTCKLGGLLRCPSLGTPLPLVEHEKPKVIYRGYVWTAIPNGPIHFTRLNDPTKWDPE